MLVGVVFVLVGPIRVPLRADLATNPLGDVVPRVKLTATILLPPPLLPPRTSRARLILCVRFGPAGSGGGGREVVAGLAEFLAHEIVPGSARRGDGIGGLEAREAEIGELGAEVSVEEDVAGLEVAVHDGRLALNVEKGERARHVADDGEPLRPVQELPVAGSGVAASEQRALEGALGHVLEDKEERALGSAAAGGRARARARAGRVAMEGNEARGFRERREEVELVQRRARLHGGERGVGEGGEVDGRGGAAAEEAGRVEPARGAAKRAAGVAPERARGVRRRGERERGVPEPPPPEEEDDDEQEQQSCRGRRGSDGGGEEGVAAVLALGKKGRRRWCRWREWLLEKAGRHGSGRRRGAAGATWCRVACVELIGVAGLV